MSRWASLFYLRKSKKNLSFLFKDTGRLILYFFMATLLAFVLVDSHVVTAEMLFQSPQSSPPAQPPPEPTDIPPTPVPVPTQPPPPPTDSPPPPTPLPTETLPVEPTSTPAPPAQPTATQPPPEPTATQPPPEEQSAALPSLPQGPLPEPVELQRDGLVFEDQAASESNFILDQAELIDTMAVSGAYIWLCCGVGLFLVAPLFLLLLYIRGRSKIIQEEGY